MYVIAVSSLLWDFLINKRRQTEMLCLEGRERWSVSNPQHFEFLELLPEIALQNSASSDEFNYYENTFLMLIAYLNPEPNNRHHFSRQVKTWDDLLCFYTLFKQQFINTSKL